MDDIVLSLSNELGIESITMNLWPVRDSDVADRSKREGEQALVEATTYGFEISAPNSIELANANLEPAEMFDLDRAGASRGRLRTGNRAGTLVVRLELTNGEQYYDQIEVVSRKLRFDDEYRWMLRDITADLASLSLNRFGPTQAQYEHIESGKPDTLYQRFAFLQAILSSEEFQQAMQQIVSKPYAASVRRLQEKPISQGIRASHTTQRQIVSRYPRRRLPKAIGSIETVPLRLEDHHFTATIDNIPNQFVKAILENWRGVAQQILDALSVEQLKTKVPVAPVERGIRESKALIDSLDSALGTPFLRSVSRLQQNPVANQVLLRRPGYRELVRINEQAQLASSLTWDGGDLVFGAGQRDVATLYEYWVFLQVGRLVAALCDERFDFGALFSLGDQGLQLNLRTNRTQVVSGWTNVSGKRFHLSLWFNRTFRRANGESWSRNMRPDLSLGIGTSDESGVLERTWVHFDAKYRIEHIYELMGEPDESQQEIELEGTTRALREDLLKMHAYRDAIRRSSGAYVIYPGDEVNAKDEVFLEYHELLPGLGAFALRPSDQGPVAGEATLQKFLTDILHHHGNVLSSERRASYWNSLAFGPPPKPPNVDPTPADSVDGLWFLERPPPDEYLLLTSEEAVIRWLKEHSLVILRTDAAPDLLALTFRSGWLVVVSKGSVSVINVDKGGMIEALPASVETGPGSWIAVTGEEMVGPPAWLTHESLSKTFTSKLMRLSWSELARQVLQLDTE